MVISNIKKGAIIFGMLLPVTAIGLSYVANNASILKLTRADEQEYSFVLNNDNAPTLTGTTGTMVDENNVTWEYYNASSSASGHITIGPNGYCGVSSTTEWGYTGIQEITANFSGGELWLLNSLDGIEWGESDKLQSGEHNITSDNWRYIRFYSYEDTVDIASVSFIYSCSGINSVEDVDNARVDRVIKRSGLDEPALETANLSPVGGSTNALSFTKTGTGTTYAIIAFDKKYIVGDFRYHKIEFDYYKSDYTDKDPKLPDIQLQYQNSKGDISTTGSNQTHTHYKTTSLGNKWRHIEIPMTALVPPFSGYKVGNEWKDPVTPTTKEFNAIKLTIGTCIIDNLRIGSSPMPLDIFNNGTEFGLNDEKPYWFKVAWVGEFYSCEFSFEDPNDPEGLLGPIAEQVAWDNTTCKSPFYMRGLRTGTVIVTATIVCGYNRQVLSISNTLTIK